MKGGGRQGDETQQRIMLDPAMIDAINAKRPCDGDMKNLSVAVYVRYGKISWSLYKPDGSHTVLSEPWVFPPLVLQRNDARSTFEAMSKHWPLRITPDCWTLERQYTDIWCDVVTDDDSRANARAELHTVEVVRSLPPWILHHRKKCNIHMASRAFRLAWRSGQFVSRNFAFFKLIQHASKLLDINAAMDSIIWKECEVHALIAPPTACAKTQQTLLDML